MDSLRAFAWSDNSTAGALWPKTWILAHPPTASGVLSRAPKQDSLLSETTDTADAARNGTGSLEEGKVEIVAKALTTPLDLDMNLVPGQEECHFPKRRKLPANYLDHTP